MVAFNGFRDMSVWPAWARFGECHDNSDGDGSAHDDANSDQNGTRAPLFSRGNHRPGGSGRRNTGGLLVRSSSRSNRFGRSVLCLLRAGLRSTGRSTLTGSLRGRWSGTVRRVASDWLASVPGVPARLSESFDGFWAEDALCCWPLSACIGDASAASVIGMTSIIMRPLAICLFNQLLDILTYPRLARASRLRMTNPKRLCCISRSMM